ncbi:MAG: hypothetical protein GY772_14185, partial [bacterium]|nr:hypothetical protein [bacterium]
ACDDASFWLDEGNWEVREAAARFHHRLVKVHVFPNGNGRHARVTADLLVHHRGAVALNWPASRDAYIGSLRAADDSDFGPLVSLLTGVPSSAGG